MDCRTSELTIKLGVKVSERIGVLNCIKSKEAKVVFHLLRANCLRPWKRVSLVVYSGKTKNTAYQITKGLLSDEVRVQIIPKGNGIVTSLRFPVSTIFCPFRGHLN